jgi:hypothetical protein
MDPAIRLAILLDAEAELTRLRASTALHIVAPSENAPARWTGVLARASEESGLSSEALRATLGRGKRPHDAIKNAVRVALEKGSTVTAVSRELGVSRRVVYDWRAEM